MADIIQNPKMREDKVAILEWEGIVAGEEEVQLLLAVGTVAIVDGKEAFCPIMEIEGLAIPKKTIDEGLMSKQPLYEYLLQQYLNFKYGMKEMGGLVH